MSTKKKNKAKRNPTDDLKIEYEWVPKKADITLILTKEDREEIDAIADDAWTGNVLSTFLFTQDWYQYFTLKGKDKKYKEAVSPGGAETWDSFEGDLEFHIHGEVGEFLRVVNDEWEGHYPYLPMALKTQVENMVFHLNNISKQDPN